MTDKVYVSAEKLRKDLANLKGTLTAEKLRPVFEKKHEAVGVPYGFPFTTNAGEILRMATEMIWGVAESIEQYVELIAKNPAACVTFPAAPPPSEDPFPEILSFIGRFSTDSDKTRQEVVEAFTQGGCYWFAFILTVRFGEQYGAEIVTDYVQNHFAARIAGRVYDITGDVTDKGDWKPWSECTDDSLKKRITDYCIMF